MIEYFICPNPGECGKEEKCHHAKPHKITNDCEEVYYNNNNETIAKGCIKVLRRLEEVDNNEKVSNM